MTVNAHLKCTSAVIAHTRIARHGPPGTAVTTVAQGLDRGGKLPAKVRGSSIKIRTDVPGLLKIVRQFSVLKFAFLGNT